MMEAKVRAILSKVRSMCPEIQDELMEELLELEREVSAKGKEGKKKAEKEKV